MNGALWAALSGVGFGVFQVLNALSVGNVARVYVGTFAQLLVATVLFVVIVAVAGSVNDFDDLPAAALGYFALSGMLHFFVGWTTLNQSQARIGAARTSPLLATTPIFGVLMTLAFTGSIPQPIAMAGITLTVLGAYVVSHPGQPGSVGLRGAGYGLTTAAAWALSAVLSVAGLRHFDDPLVGVTVGMAAATAAYGLVLLVVPATRHGQMSRDAWTFKLVAGVVVALATWWRWLGLAGAPVGVVLALQLLTVPTVLLIVAFRPGGELVDRRVWLGSAAVIGGVALLLAQP